LAGIGLENATVSGDTRFDRVWANAQQPRSISGLEAFKNGQRTFVAGSTWPEDEQLIAKLVARHPDLKFIIAPHEISEEKINKLAHLLPAAQTIKYSEISNLIPIAIGMSPDSYRDSNLNVLIIDNIGMLSSLYQYGEIAYIGGGFGAGIHNTLEAAAFGLPVIFGPNYRKFIEANDLIALKAGFSITDGPDLEAITVTLLNDSAFYATSSKKAGDYVKEHIGATGTIVEQITNNER
jgi:3-deoxy-D-manno-octulosonic-acid transferase